MYTYTYIFLQTPYAQTSSKIVNTIRLHVDKEAPKVHPWIHPQKSSSAISVT